MKKYLWVNAQIFTTGQPKSCETSLFLLLLFSLGALYSISKQSLQLGKGFFNFGNSSRTVDEFPSRWMKLVFG